MSRNHLPECLVADDLNLCICDRLRSCEARIREDADRAATVSSEQLGEIFGVTLRNAAKYNFQQGYAKGYLACEGAAR